ncbi:MAG: glycosyltransferase family 39 protein [Armatimonadetes bacterium]|nr:glycosyltransferase family 39 protein [Armatimonadota bacterium]
MKLPQAQLRNLAQPVGLLVLCAALCVTRYVRTVGDLTQPEALESAQVARNVAEGKGFTTDSLRPADLRGRSNLKQRPAQHVAPVPTLLTALVFRLGGATDRAAALASGILLAPTLVLVFLLGGRVGGPLVGGLATLLYAGSATALAHAFAGTATQTTALLILLWTYVGVSGVGALDDKDAPRWSVLRLLAAGVVFGLLMLTDWHLALLWPVALALATKWSADWSLPRAVGLLLVGGLVVVTPWLVRNQRATGSPFSSHYARQLATDTRRYPGSVLERTLSRPDTAGASALALKKAAFRLLGLRDYFTQWADPYLLALFLVALFACTATDAGAMVKVVLLCLLLPRALLGCLFDQPVGGFVPFLPLAVMLVAELLVRYGRVAAAEGEGGDGGVPWQLRLRRAAPAVAVLALTLIPTVQGLVVGKAPHNPDADLKALTQTFRPGEVLVSDAPWSVAWYGKCPAVWAPLTPHDLDRLQQTVTPIAGIALTSQTRTNVGEPYPEALPWQAFRDDPGFLYGFRPETRLANGTLVYRRVEKEGE